MTKLYSGLSALAVLLTSGNLLAQPTLSYSNTGFAAGDVYTALSLDTTNVTPGPGGANQTWDFSQVTTNGSPLTMEVHNVAGSAYDGQYPGANVYAASGVGNDFTISNNSEWSRVAVISPGATINYSDPQKLLQYPFTFNNSYTDNFSGTVTAAGASMQRQGTMVAEADGYGTLVLPNGQSLTDVLRVKYSEDYTDQYMGATTTYHSDHHFWYKPGFHGPVLAISSVFVNGQFYYKQANLTEFITVSAPEDIAVQMQADVYPNPAKESVTIRADFAQHNTVAAVLVNNLGQEVRRENLTITNPQLNLHGISQGVYFLQLNASGKTETHKLVVE